MHRNADQPIAVALQQLGRQTLRLTTKDQNCTIGVVHLDIPEESLHLHAGEIAVMCVLMLRGPQTVGEIRTRTARLFDFVDLTHVEVTLQALITLSTPLVVQLPRRPGQKEVRYAHLLSGEPQVDMSEPMPTAESQDHTRMEALEQSIDSLRAELASLRVQFEEFRRQFN